MIRYRTAALVVVGFLVLLVGLALCLRYPAIGAQVFSPFASAVVFAIAIGASKSAVEHLAGGGGIAGAAKALFTAAKPEPKEAP